MAEDYQGLTPPPELVDQLLLDSDGIRCAGVTRERHLIAAAYRAGADQELEACCEWLDFYAATAEARDLRLARRPKPPSVAEQALEDFDGLMTELDGAGNYSNCAKRILRALERLQELENNG